MCLWLSILGGVLFLSLTTAVNIKNIMLQKNNLDVKEGEMFAIPCRFWTETPAKPNDVRLAWEYAMLRNNAFLPVYQVADAVLESVPTPNPFRGRAHMIIATIPEGDCSLIVNPALASDTGRFKLNIYSDGAKKTSRVVQVYVRSQFHGTGLSFPRGAEPAPEPPTAAAEAPPPPEYAPDPALRAHNPQPPPKVGGGAVDKDDNSCMGIAEVDSGIIETAKVIRAILKKTGLTLEMFVYAVGSLCGILFIGNIITLMMWSCSTSSKEEISEEESLLGD
ncbi:uncharacterized protein LOC121307775 [Polyodon spathula]|uniref:uncharacterized protein LOC121307775 n=1 Tax=Polyodon spathula TaxID=7913 RepID=UPI001B7F6DC1|nr:uncharacterized protein LOC121307775 [Polyodon spathula]